MKVMTERTFSVLVYISVMNFCIWHVKSQTFPTKETVNQWVADLDRTFRDATSGDSDITGANLYQKQFQSSLNNGFNIKKPDGREILQDYAKKLEELFDANIRALKNLQEKAEKVISRYQYNHQLDLNDIKPLYINVNNIDNERNISHLMKFSEHFNQEIYDGQSGVQIPIEIYEGYPEILNGLKWSTGLDEAFKENREDFPDIYWQSFGSEDGFTRFFPTTRWRTFEEIPDLYDVRRRPWYIHGSVSPKDIVVLLDTSGSMHGQSFDIMKLAAKTLLNTLGENDFVNVAQFAGNVSWVTPCLDTLVQANSRNKRLIFDGIDQLVDHKIANYADALTFAYEQLEKFSREKDNSNGEGSNCHKLIMFFSDGGTDFPKHIVDAFVKNGSGDVRIFSYAVGPHPLPTVALKNMACETGGSFSSITAMGAIRSKIQSSYLSVIAHPEVLSGKHVLGYSSVYTDALDYARVLSKPLVLSNSKPSVQYEFFSPDHLGLGMITTLTLPVFNTSKDSDNQTLAGVVGIDIPVFKFENAIPRGQVGPLGYVFGVNPNGFLVFHPSLWMDSNFLQDPSHIDLTDIQGESEFIDQLRRRMIDSQINKIETLEESDPLDFESRTPLKGKRNYFFTKIGESSLS